MRRLCFCLCMHYICRYKIKKILSFFPLYARTIHMSVLKEKLFFCLCWHCTYVCALSRRVYLFCFLFLPWKRPFHFGSVYVYMYVCMCTCVHVYVYICMYVRMYPCIYVYVPDFLAGKHVYIIQSSFEALWWAYMYMSYKSHLRFPGGHTCISYKTHLNFLVAHLRLRLFWAYIHMSYKIHLRLYGGHTCMSYKTHPRLSCGHTCICHMYMSYKAHLRLCGGHTYIYVIKTTSKIL